MTKNKGSRKGPVVSQNRMILRPAIPRKKSEWQKKSWQSKNGPVMIVKRAVVNKTVDEKHNP